MQSNIIGNATSIDGVIIDISDAEDGKALVYDLDTNTIKFKPVSASVADDPDPTLSADLKLNSHGIDTGIEIIGKDEIGALSGVSGNLQHQINAKSAADHSHDDKYIRRDGDAVSGEFKISNGSLKVLGTAASDPVMARGISGADTNCTEVDTLYLNYSSNKPVVIGSDKVEIDPSAGLIKVNGTPVVLANDSRLTDARTPKAHTHSGQDITSIVDNANHLDGHDSSYFANNAHLHDDKYLGINDTATAAQKLATPRNIILSGDVTGISAYSFDGTADATINTSVANDSHTHDTRYYTIHESTDKFLGKTETATNSAKFAGYTTAHFSALGHTHEVSDINNLQTKLDHKFDTTGGMITGSVVVRPSSEPAMLQIFSNDNSNAYLGVSHDKSNFKGGGFFTVDDDNIVRIGYEDRINDNFGPILSYPAVGGPVTFKETPKIEWVGPYNQIYTADVAKRDYGTYTGVTGDSPVGTEFIPNIVIVRRESTYYTTIWMSFTHGGSISCIKMFVSDESPFSGTITVTDDVCITPDNYVEDAGVGFRVYGDANVVDELYEWVAFG